MEIKNLQKMSDAEFLDVLQQHFFCSKTSPFTFFFLQQRFRQFSLNKIEFKNFVKLFLNLVILKSVFLKYLEFCLGICKIQKINGE